jgi:hypothetical protein
LTLTVLLPTPPLPEPTAITFLTLGRICSAVRGAARRTVAPQVIATSLAPSARSSRRAFASISSFSGQAGVVSSIVKATDEPSIAIDLTISSVTMSRPSSGSWTRRSASRMAASVRAVMRAGDLGSGTADGSLLTAGASISSMLPRRPIRRSRGHRRGNASPRPGGDPWHHPVALRTSRIPAPIRANLVGELPVTAGTSRS